MFLLPLMLSFVYGFTICLVCGFGVYYLILWLATLNYLPQVVGIVASLVFAFGKESYDASSELDNSKFNWWHILLTMIGCFAAVVAIYVLQTN